jgi:hypothetical protein
MKYFTTKSLQRTSPFPHPAIGCVRETASDATHRQHDRQLFVFAKENYSGALNGRL